MRSRDVPRADRRPVPVPLAAQRTDAMPDLASGSDPCQPVPSATGLRHASAHTLRHAADFSGERGEWRVVRSRQCTHDHVDRRDRGTGSACIPTRAGVYGSMCTSTLARILWGPQRGKETCTHELTQAALEAVAVNGRVSVLRNYETHASVRER